MISLYLTSQCELKVRIGESVLDLQRTFAFGRWYFVGISYSRHSGIARLFGGLSGAMGPSGIVSEKIGSVSNSAPSGLFLAADARAPIVRPAFNGKIGHLMLFNFSADDVDVCRIQNGWRPDQRESLLGEWDFSLNIESDQIVDVSGAQRHGHLFQGPTRGVTGPLFTGSDNQVYLAAPQEYNAVHFHEDDLENALWTPTAEFSIPHSARSGIYGLLFQNETGDTWTCPFVVKASSGRRADLLFVVPTLTWLAYGNRGRRECERLFGPSLYSTHRDGSPVYHASLLRPIATIDPGFAFTPTSLSSDLTESCSHMLMTDLYTIHWLEQEGIPYDVICDQDFHKADIEELKSYRTIICAGHHEYWTCAMLDGMEEYLAGKGRAMFLTGNALYWVSSIHPDKEYLLEVRRRSGSATSVADVGELQHAFETCKGGTWQSAGRPPNRITGLGFSVTGISEKGGGFQIETGLPSATGFIFEGMDTTQEIGSFGLNLGGAAGFELDRCDYSRGTPSAAYRLARTQNLPPSFFGAVEEGIGRSPEDPKVCGDLVYIERPDGGKVFSAGSVTWSGSLSHNDYRNNVAQLTRNVLKNFLAE